MSLKADCKVTAMSVFIYPVLKVMIHIRHVHDDIFLQLFTAHNVEFIEVFDSSLIQRKT